MGDLAKRSMGEVARAYGAAREEAPPELFEAARVLFLRLEQLQGADRVGFAFEPGKGVEYTVEVHLYEVVRAKGDKLPEYRKRAATGAGPEGALRKLVADLAEAVRNRVKADVGALTLAGLPLGPEFVAEGWGRHVRHQGAADPAQPVTVDAEGEEVDDDGRSAMERHDDDLLVRMGR